MLASSAAHVLAHASPCASLASTPRDADAGVLPRMCQLTITVQVIPCYCNGTACGTNRFRAGSGRAAGRAAPDARGARALNSVDFGVVRTRDTCRHPARLEARSMLARGVLRPGDRVPSRPRARRFRRVNVNTARAVYRELSRRSWISSNTAAAPSSASGRSAYASSARSPSGSRLRRVSAGFDPRLLAATLYRTRQQPRRRFRTPST